MAHVMVATGIHAARHLDLEIPDVMQVIQLGKMGINLVGHVYGTGIGQVAEVQSRAADHVREQADVGCCQTFLLQGMP